MTERLQQFLAKLRDVKQVGPNQWSAKCPAHDDGTNSLSLSLGEGNRILAYCHAKCGAIKIATAVGERMTIFMPEKMPASGIARKSDLGPIVKTYDYIDADGNLRHQTTRHSPKNFRQRRPDGKGGWAWSLTGIETILYRLPELLNANEDRPDDWRFLCEGEKDVDSLAAAGLIATCNPMGAGKWHDRYSESLRGYRCCIIADADEPGRKHANEVASSLSLHGVREVKVIEVGNGKDASDFLAAGGVAADLVAKAEAAPAWTEAAIVVSLPSANARQSESEEGIPLTEYGNAQRLAKRFGHKFRWNASRGCWILYDNGRWIVDESGEVYRAAKSVARSFYEAAARSENPDDLFKHGKASEKASGIEAMVRLARSEPGTTITSDQLDVDPMLFNVLNGTIDLRSGKLRQHNPGDLLTKLAPVHYNQAATAPLWRGFLNRIMPSSVMQGYLSRIIGLCATGDASEQELYIYHGSGGNGKNVFLDVVSGTIGDYACEAAPSLLTAKASEDHPTEIADLQGRRMVVANETEEGARLRVQLVKRLTGNAKLKARFMRQDFFEFPRTHKLILVTNNRPLIRETTNAIWRRIRLIPFSVTIPKPEQDAGLIPKLLAESPGILRWIVDGCLAWQREGMNTPREVLVATEGYQVEQDPLAEFLAAKCATGEDERVSRTELLAAYQSWARSIGDGHALDRASFYEHVRRIAGVEETMLRYEGTPTRVFTGIGLCDLSSDYRRAQEGAAA